MLRPTSFGQGKKSPGTASMMLPGGSKEEEIFIFGLHHQSQISFSDQGSLE